MTNDHGQWTVTNGNCDGKGAIEWSTSMSSIAMVCIRKNRYIYIYIYFFFLFDTTLGFSSFERLQSFLRLLLCLYMRGSVCSSFPQHLFGFSSDIEVMVVLAQVRILGGGT